jgi:aspartyl-tRNA synthetase
MADGGRDKKKGSKKSIVGFSSVKIKKCCTALYFGVYSMMRTHYVKEAREVGSKSVVTIAGWVHDVRDLGKLKFVHVRDTTGIIQVTMKKGEVPDDLLQTVAVNKEDIVTFTGTIKENKIAPDGVELVPSRFKLLNKVERKLPIDPTEKVQSDVDTRLNFRYLDLRVQKIASIFKIKSAAVRAFREKTSEMGFLEIHPSAITGAATEGGADVFQIQYFENRAYLVQSPQLYKQLAVIGGLDRVAMTVPVFRAEKHNTTTHLNEITQMDVEIGFADHNDAMDVLEEVIVHILSSVKNSMANEAGRRILPSIPNSSAVRNELKTANAERFEIVIPKKVPRYTYSEMVEKLNAHGFRMRFGEDFSKEAEKKMSDILGEELYFIYDWPTDIRAFYSMPSDKNPKVCHAFDLVYRGLEIASGAQRIHQAAKLEAELKRRGLELNEFEFYLNAFRMGAPPHAGWSIGLERLVMKMCNLSNIREAMLFPRDRTRVHP